MIDAASSLIRDAWMPAVVPGKPVVGGVAGGAVDAKHPRMEGRIAMTTYARTGQARKLSIRMALLTSQPNMAAC